MLSRDTSLHRSRAFALVLSLVPALGSCAAGADERPEPADAPEAASPPTGRAFTVGAGEPFRDVPEEEHLRNVRQLTFDGENAEAYFSFDGTKLVYQRTPAHGGCDQIYSMDLATGATHLVSTGAGRTTCSFYYPGDDRILYSSTHLADAACPPAPDFSMGYVWAVYDGFDIFVTDAEGTEHVRLTDTSGYDAEATISPLGDRMVFTSLRNGDLDLYTMNLDGSDVLQVTDETGYDGGAFFSPDGTRLVWRAHYPRSDEETADYRRLVGEGLIRPTTLEIYVANADGSGKRQVTSNGAANFGPYWHPSGEKIIFSSNMDDPLGREFDLYMIGTDGTGLDRITYTPEFDGFPMWSPDGRWLVWGSNRNMSHEGNTNIFVAEWVEEISE
jgi:Tol biopolymer transport system component